MTPDDFTDAVDRVNEVILKASVGEPFQAMPEIILRVKQTSSLWQRRSARESPTSCGGIMVVVSMSRDTPTQSVIQRNNRGVPDRAGFLAAGSSVALIESLGREWPPRRSRS